jgi:hypothetical protein
MLFQHEIENRDKILKEEGFLFKTMRGLNFVDDIKISDIEKLGNTENMYFYSEKQKKYFYFIVN